MIRQNEFDRHLLEQVMPEGIENPEPAENYNLVVIGAGTAGLVTAAGAAGLGARVALIERSALGGDCLNLGCVPSKSLLRSAHAVADLRRSEDLGIRISGNIEIDFEAVMNRMRRIRAEIAKNDSVTRFRDELGVDVFLGEGRFIDKKRIEVDDLELSFQNAVIATGARSRILPIPGLEEVGYLTNESVFDLEVCPEQLLVLGGGPIGCELAQAFSRLGSKVTLLEAEPQFLSREDPEAAAILHESLKKDGIDVRLSTQIESVTKESAGYHRALLKTAQGSSEELQFDQILVAIGRAPNVENLGLEEAGVAFDLKNGVEISDCFQTSQPHIYAVGDVCMQLKFTHAADAAARAVIQNALFSVGPVGKKTLSSLTIPWCTYTDPEIAHVGLSEKDAEDQGTKIDTYTRPLSEVDRAITDGRTNGFVKIHVAKGGDTILGATIVAPNAGDLISEIGVAMAADMGLGGLANVIHPYPTVAEAIRQTGTAYMRTRLTPTVAGLFERYLSWRR
ncbi:MAG: mercuric reductase [Deltaproteobacteria bacterium]|nr:mercuric reductase [Deltaproteobacteria bacterium]